MNDKSKILLVEDEIPLAMMLVAVLTQAGFEVTAALTGQKGLELATTNKCDLIVLDVDLLDLNGYRICAELKTRHITVSTPVLLVSGRSSQQDVKRGLDAGAADYLIKPLKASDFVQRISTLLKTPPAFGFHGVKLPGSTWQLPPPGGSSLGSAERTNVPCHF